MEIVDGSNHRNIYQSKRNVQGETRMAITTHADADLGVCFTNTLDKGKFSISTRGSQGLNGTLIWSDSLKLLGVNNADGKLARAVDLDVDIGADAVDYNAIAKAGTFIVYMSPKIPS